MFRSISNMTEVQGQSPDVRVFRGTDTEYLNIGKCRKVSGVRVSGIELPEVMDQVFPHPGNHEQKLFFPVPMWMTEKDSAGDTYLLRTDQSNNGIWQAGKDERPCLIQVSGEWDDEKPADTKGVKVSAPGGKAG